MTKCAAVNGTLYIVSTPIGNLEDITQRGLRILREVDLIACEDTRHTRKLLDHFGIGTKTISYHEHNETERANQLCQLLADGNDVAVVSDAGTPLVSDPGFRIVKAAIANRIQVVPVPGASALVAALAASGLPTDRFLFAGFLPPRAGARKSQLEDLRSVEATLIFYEAPHRIGAALRDAREVLGNREATVARELTKLHEQFVRGTLGDLADKFSDVSKARGEMVLLIAGAGKESDREQQLDSQPSPPAFAGRIKELQAAGLEEKAALKKAAREFGLKRDEAYRLLVTEKNRLK